MTAKRPSHFWLILGRAKRWPKISQKCILLIYILSLRRLGIHLPVTRPLWDLNLRPPASESQSFSQLSHRCHYKNMISISAHQFSTLHHILWEQEVGLEGVGFAPIGVEQSWPIGQSRSSPGDLAARALLHRAWVSGSGTLTARSRRSRAPQARCAPTCFVLLTHPQPAQRLNGLGMDPYSSRGLE